LAKRDLNLSAIVGRSAEARERRLVPEVIEGFFINAGPIIGVSPKETRPDSHVYRLGRVPRSLWPIGEQLEPRFGKLGREYKQVVFDKLLLVKDPTSEWVTPGHALFESVRHRLSDVVRDDLLRGGVFYDLHHPTPCRLDVFSASIKDGRGNQLHRRLFVVQSDAQGNIAIKQPTIFLDLALAPKGTAVPSVDGPPPLPARPQVEKALIEHSLLGFLAEITAQRERETQTIRKHVEISLNELIHRQNLTLARLVDQQQRGDQSPLLQGNIKQAEDRIDELNGRLERRMQELAQERQCAIGDIQFHGSAWALPHPERTAPGIAPMVRDEEIERLAVQAVIAYEEAHGRKVESVETENRGFDLISRKPHAEDPATAIEVRFIEVKGRGGIGEVALTGNEFKTAERLKNDFWLYVVFNCGTTPQVHVIRNPAALGWQAIVTVEHYRVGPQQILAAANAGEVS